MNSDEVLDQFNAREIRHEVVVDRQVELFGLNRLPSDSAIFGGVRIAAMANHRVSAKMAYGALIIRHENATGRTRVALPWRASWLSRWPEFGIFHGTTIGPKILPSLWGVHPIAEGQPNSLICLRNVEKRNNERTNAATRQSLSEKPGAPTHPRRRDDHLRSRLHLKANSADGHSNQN
jgi:hypothetical protein